MLDGFTERYETVARTEGSQNTLMFQVGANMGEAVAVGLGAVNLGALGMEGLDVVDQAARVILQVDRALNHVVAERGRAAAQLNRFERVVEGLQNQSENLSAARGRLQDADFATETAQLARSQILKQTGNAMLAQANSLPSMVLSLLRL